MKKSFKYLIVSTAICFVFYSCSSGGDDGPAPNPDPVVIDPPGKATLIFPNENSECTEGTNFTSTESDVVFDWNDSSNTDTYQLVLKNLETQIISNHNSSISEVSITILRATPYSWYIVSKSNSTAQTEQSATWKFYNSGEAVSSYAPFPAELVTPNMGSSLDASTNSVNLEWAGSDVDNDIAEYEILFDIVNPPTNIEGSTTSSSMIVTVTSGSTYYWRVVTKDSEGSTSNSEIFQFKVK